MGLLYAIIFLHAGQKKKVNIKKTSQIIKKDSIFIFQVISQLLQSIFMLIKFISKQVNGLNKKVCKAEIKAEIKKVKVVSNVINLNEYKLKKAK